MSKTHYFDTSALVKRYFEEKGSRAVARIFSEHRFHAVASIAYAEFYAAVHRLNRDGLLNGKGLASACEKFEADWKGLIVVDFTAETRKSVPALLKKSSLRGADAVQLACAVMLAEREIPPVFVASDLRLINAARDHGLKVLNPEDTA